MKLEQDTSFFTENNDMTQAEIDFVIIWVDGDDPNHQLKRKRHLSILSDDELSIRSQDDFEVSISDLRFVQSNELKYCLRSIKRYAPWYRKIILITDQQLPKFLDSNKLFLDRIEIVDHKELFKDTPEFLPTFNSRAIVTALHTLDCLSEQFILGNDDLMLSADVTPSFFFEGRKPIVRGSWCSLPKNDDIKLHMQGILNSAFMLDYSSSSFLVLSHAFVSLDKARLNKLAISFSDEFMNNKKYKFRHRDQFLVESLYNHYCMKYGEGILGDFDFMVHFSIQLCREGAPEKIDFLFDLIMRKERKTFCINEFQSLLKISPNLHSLLDEICGPMLDSEIKM